MSVRVARRREGEGDELEPEVVADLTPNVTVGAHNLLDFVVDEEIERVDVLLDQALDLEKGRQQLKLVLGGADGIRELLAVIEWLEEGLEAVVSERHGECYRGG